MSGTKSLNLMQHILSSTARHSRILEILTSAMGHRYGSTIDNAIKQEHGSETSATVAKFGNRHLQGQRPHLDATALYSMEHC